MNQQSRQAISPRMAGLGERLEYRFVVSLAFLLCLVAVVARRITGKSEGGNVFNEAYSAAMAAVGYAYTV